MKIESRPFKQIDRDYTLTSAELRKALNLKGEILHMGLNAGLSPAQEERGESHEKDTWTITTREIKKTE